MKQVWQAEDGTIFEKEIACEKYESKLAYRETLYATLLLEWNKIDAETLMKIINSLVYNGHRSKLINFIKAIGEQDAN